MRFVGMLCNCSPDADPRAHLSTSLINRAFLIDRELRGADARLFLYSPANVRPGEAVAGYRVEGEELEADLRPPPGINANWTYGTRKLIDRGMGYRRFKQWAIDQGLQIYVPYEFSELVSNKRKTYDAVRAFDPDLHPHTEEWTGAKLQLAGFLERAPIVFVKPRAGNRGNRIFVLRQEGSGGPLALRYYDDGEQRLLSPITLDAALRVIETAATRKRYVIQEGIDSVRHDGAVFDVRVVMVNDGERWHSILETRLAPGDSDLSNVFQGGSIHEAEQVLAAVYGESVAKGLEVRLRESSHRLAEHLESDRPGELMELGFDFVLDADGGIHLVEINAKPGIAGFGSERRLFDWTPEDAPFNEKWVLPHTRHLASFLLAKLDAAPADLSGTGSAAPARS